MAYSIAGDVLGIPKMSSQSRLLLSESNSKHHISYFPNDSSKLKQMKLGLKVTDAVKEKLSLGVKILQTGGVTKVFKQNFSVREGEKLLKVFQYYLSTTAGPIAGLFFISSDKVAFCSDRSIKTSSQMGELIKIQYKVVIPLWMKRASESMNVNKPSKKYLEIVTVDDFDFWFMGFLNYQKTFKYLQQAISQAHQSILACNSVKNDSTMYS